MGWNIVDNRNFFPKIESYLGFYRVLLTTLKTYPEKIALTIIELQELPDLQKLDHTEEVFCLKGKITLGRRKVCQNFKTDTNKLDIVMYRY